MTANSDMAALLRFSSRIGLDPLLVQASSGNTSLKVDGTLWIKASGTWLANAEQKDIFVSVRLSDCLASLNEGRPLPTHEQDSSPPCLRPSIETLMHAVIPDRFAIHVHCVSTLAWGVRSDAPARLAERLAGLRWTWIPYVPSGVPLAREVRRVCSTLPYTDVFILGNHGLLVCAEACNAAERLLREVQQRLAAQPRPAANPNLPLLERLSGISSWVLPEREVLHTLGTDAISQSLAAGGTLYPCQAIFLGRTLPFLPSSDSTSYLARQIDQLEPSCSFVVLEGSGILLNRSITPAEHAVLEGFAELLRRIEPSAPIRYLTDCEVNNVLTADAHSYRTSAERQHVSIVDTMRRQLTPCTRTQT